MILWDGHNLIPKIKQAIAKDDFILYVSFDDGTSVLYDVKEDIKEINDFKLLLQNSEMFKHFEIDESRTIVSWTDRIDLPSDIIREYGKVINQI